MFLSSSGITGETGWSDSSGGYATYDISIYSQPVYQSIDPQVPHNGYRDVPDLAFIAAPYIATYFNGGFVAYSGTSYAVPMFAGIIAGLDQNGGGAYGFINNAIYDILYTSGAYNDVTTGTGWGYVTGFGSVNALPFIQQVEEYYACNCN
ncbi:MAG: hypothetical protein M0T81_03760 [Thermoplasmatales archaeon]|nr:hypothetical protein [Thermoplasmatales archaeon]